MTTINETALTIQPMDRETIGALASFTIEKQAQVKGFILGLLERDSGLPSERAEDAARAGVSA